MAKHGFLSPKDLMDLKKATRERAFRRNLKCNFFVQKLVKDSLEKVAREVRDELLVQNIIQETSKALAKTITKDFADKV